MEKTVPSSSDVVKVTNIDSGNANVLNQFAPTFFIDILQCKLSKMLTLKRTSFDNVNSKGEWQVRMRSRVSNIENIEFYS